MLFVLSIASALDAALTSQVWPWHRCTEQFNSAKTSKEHHTPLDILEGVCFIWLVCFCGVEVKGNGTLLNEF